MTQNEKELLLKDLCARLPFNHLVEYKGEEYNVLGIAHGRLVLCKPFMSYTLNEHPLVEEVKPYLFPLSSMTGEQYVEFVNLGNATSDDCFDGVNFNQLDWLIAHHFDYRGLIEKGLAIDATGLNIY